MSLLGSRVCWHAAAPARRGPRASARRPSRCCSRSQTVDSPPGRWPSASAAQSPPHAPRSTRLVLSGHAVRPGSGRFRARARRSPSGFLHPRHHPRGQEAVTNSRIVCDYGSVAARRLGCVLLTEDLAARIVAADALVRNDFLPARSHAPQSDVAGLCRGSVRGGAGVLGARGDGGVPAPDRHTHGDQHDRHRLAADGARNHAAERRYPARRPAFLDAAGLDRVARMCARWG